MMTSSIPAKGAIPPQQLATIALQRHHGVGVAMQVQNRHSDFCQWFQSVNRVLFAQTCGKLGLSQAVSWARLTQSGPA